MVKNHGVAKKASGRLLPVLWELRTAILLVMLCILFSFASSLFLSKMNIVNILRQVSVNGLLSIGMTFVILSGGIDFSAGSILSLGSVVVAGFVSSAFPYAPTVDPLFAIFLGLLAGTVLGALNGLVISTIKVRAAPFVVTLGMLILARWLALGFSHGMPIRIQIKSFLLLGHGRLGFLPVQAIVFMVVLALAWVVLHRTWFGRHVYAVGGNARILRASGIGSGFVIFMVYAISGFLSALGGILFAARVSAGIPLLGQSRELDAIAAAIIGGTMTGGRGSLLGTLFGVLILGVLRNGLDLMGVASFYQQMAVGLFIVGAVVLNCLQPGNDR